MCGIAGVLCLEAPSSQPDRRLVERMIDRLRHRGPDARGLYQDPRCVLGNARLKIIDPSDNAAMPMSNDDGSVWLTYNGEISNFRELKAEFKLDGKYRFRSSSDTEVLLRLYEEHGIDCLRRLSGMFSFCLYDRRRQKAFVVRDFFGITPLFYMQKGRRLYFASEIKAFLHLPEFRPEMDFEAFHHYFSLAYIPLERTPFADVREMRAGELIEIDFAAGSVDRRPYYSLQYRQDLAMDEREGAARLHELLLDSVRRHLIADVPLGMTLSGGMDTSTILGLAKELGASERMHTFSLKMGEESFDESRYQRLMAGFARSIHHEIPVGPRQVQEALVEHMAFMDEPIGDGSAIPSFILAREAKRHVSVLLSGEGGDEVFSAYETHGAYRWRKLYRSLLPAPLRSLLRRAAPLLPVSYKKLSFDFKFKRFVEGAELEAPRAHLYWRHVFTEGEKRRLLGGADFQPTDELFSELYHGADFDDDFNRISLLDIVFFFHGDLMLKNDRMILAHSIEARFPLMDRMVVEFASRIPVSLRLKGLQRRYLQKRAMEGRLPPAILRRDNFGLEMPHSLWFLKELRPLGERYFRREQVGKSGILDPGFVAELWEQHLSGRRDNGRPLWCILLFLIWFDLFIDRRDSEPLHAVYPGRSTVPARTI